MSFNIPDRVLWLGIGAGIYALVRAVSYGLHDVYNLTEVAPTPDSPRAVAQGTEDDIPLPSLQVLATQHPNLEIRKAATSIVTTRVLNDPSTIRRILADYKKPDGAPDQRAARNAIQLIRSTNGIDLEDWEEDHNNEDDATVAVEVGFDPTEGRQTTTTTGGTAGRSRSTTDMRREMASRYWAVEHVGDGDDWDDASDDNSHAADVTSDDGQEQHDDQDQDPTITVPRGGAAAPQQQPPQPSRRAGEFEAFIDDILGTEAAAAAAAADNDDDDDDDDGIEATYGTAAAPRGNSSNGSVLRADGDDDTTTVWDRSQNRSPESRRAHGLREQRRRGGGETTTVVEDVPRPHGRRHLRARSSRENEEEVARRRVRREAVVVNDGDRPISQDDIIQRPLHRRSY